MVRLYSMCRIVDRLIVEEAREQLFSTFYRVPGRCGEKGRGSVFLALVRADCTPTRRGRHLQS